MKTKIIILTLALGTSMWPLIAQHQNSPRHGQRPAPRQGLGPAETELLTDAQIAQVKAILAK